MNTVRSSRPAIGKRTTRGTVYRNRTPTIVARVGIVVLVLYATAQGVRLGMTDAATIPEMFLPAIAVSPILLLLWRGAIARASADEAGLRIVNLTRTHFIHWEDIKGFSVEPLHLLPKVGIVELRNGERVGIWSIQGSNPVIRPNNTSAEKLIEALNVELARHTSGRTRSPTT